MAAAVDFTLQPVPSTPSADRRRACTPAAPPLAWRAGSKTITGLRLVDGPSAREGRVEVQILGKQWGTVPAGDSSVARAVCRQLGFATGYARTGFYGTPTLGRILEAALCTGAERSLEECTLVAAFRKQPWDWDDKNDALGVACSGTWGVQAPPSRLTGQSRALAL